MGDLKDARVIKFKGCLFLVAALVSAGVLLGENFTLRTAFLLSVAIWSACRFYYFAFYVIEHYVDSNFKFAGLWDFARYSWKRRGGTKR